MNPKELEQKRAIISRLINSGINISPPSLDLILSLESPLKTLNLIIKETSFIPSFKNHLTLQILQKLSIEEIKKALKRRIQLQEIDQPQLEDIEHIQEVRPQIAKVSQSTSQNIIDLDMALKEVSNTYSKPSQMSKNKKIKYEGAKSNTRYRSIAKDYPESFKILEDPSKKIYTNGEYNDFYQLTLDKYNQLRNLMRKRPDMASATNINNIFRLTRNIEISTLGLVSDIYQSKNGHYFITIEDLTGEISVLVRNISDNANMVKLIERTIKDQMISVIGTFNPGEKGKKGIIFADSISKIDIPTDFTPNVSQDPLSIALISDTHIGSKEFEETLFKKFLKFLNGKDSNKNLRDVASRIKYLVINGDLIDGIGVYPNQQDDLIIPDIYKQYEKATELLAEVPDHIKIFYVSGNHEPVRNAIPRPAVPKKYCEDLYNLDVICLGNPSIIKTHDVNTLIYHGESMHDINMLIHDIDINNPIESMKEFLICRHLAPTYGEKTQIAPMEKDLLVIDNIPDIFHTGHVHINGVGKYRNVSLVNSGCFQAQTDFMKSFGITPTPGIVSIIELDTLRPISIDFKKL